ncbi:MAG: VanZ family protein [Mariprofundaceae bacterium]|nr:VanZ family protein [Mariprofundaceae bacterium]
MSKAWLKSINLSIELGVMMRLKYSLILLIFLLLAVGFESTCAATINNDVIPYLDKMVHFFVFGLLAYLIAISLFKMRSQASLLGVAIISLILVALLGMGNEWIQSFTPGRIAGVDDVLADMFGGFIFLAVWVVVQMKLERGD